MFGASLLPALFARLATSHYLYVLPYGRTKLLASAFATVALTALFAAGIVTMYYYKMPFALDLMFQRAFAVSFVTASFLYVVLWLTGKSGTIGLLVGSFVMIATLVLPLRFIAMPSTSLAMPWTACALLWSVFAASFLLAPRLKAPLGRLRHALARPHGLELPGRRRDRLPDRHGAPVDARGRPSRADRDRDVSHERLRRHGAVASEPVAVLPHDHQRHDGRRREPRRHAQPRAVAARALDARGALQPRRELVLALQLLHARRAAPAARRDRRCPSTCRRACSRSAWACSRSAPRSAPTSGSS